MSGGWGISYEIALRWMPLDLTDDKSTLVQVMAWCHQATSHYLSQCWPRSVSPNDVARPQWVNSSIHWGLKKRSPSCRQHLLIHYLQRKFVHFELSLNDDLSDNISGSIKVMAWCQTGNQCDHVISCHMVLLGINELTNWFMGPWSI